MSKSLLALLLVAVAAVCAPPGAMSSAVADELRLGGTGSALGLLQRLGEVYATLRRGDSVTVLPSLGSAGGIAAVRDGAIDIAVSGRALTGAERQSGLRDAPLLRSPLALATSRRDPPGLRLADLPQLFERPEAVWSDGVPLRIILRSPSETSVTYLASLVPGLAAAIDAARTRRYIPVAATDQDNFALARATPGSLTLALLVQLKTEGDDLSAVAIDGVAPSLEALADGRYQPAMTLSIVAATQRREPAVRFLAFLRSPEAAAIIRAAGGSAFDLPVEF